MSQCETTIAPKIHGVRDAVSATTRRCGFSPEALQMLDQTIEGSLDRACAGRGGQ